MLWEANKNPVDRPNDPSELHPPISIQARAARKTVEAKVQLPCTEYRLTSTGPAGGTVYTPFVPGRSSSHGCSVQSGAMLVQDKTAAGQALNRRSMCSLGDEVAEIACLASVSIYRRRIATCQCPRSFGIGARHNHMVAGNLRNLPCALRY